jgi:uncharacterized membrane protein YedE/YeeE
MLSIESAPTPLQSFLGGTLLALSMHTLSHLNGSVLGCSGLVHRSIKANLGSPAWREAVAGVTGLISAGALSAYLGREAPALVRLPIARNILSGLLVGLGSRLQNGCTSGHMIAGIARLSPRSLVATGLFSATAMLTANFSATDAIRILPSDNALSASSVSLLLAQALPFGLAAYLWTSVSFSQAARTSLIANAAQLFDPSLDYSTLDRLHFLPFFRSRSSLIQLVKRYQS